MSNLTFGHNVFKSRLLLLFQNASAGGKGLTLSNLQTHFDVRAAADICEIAIIYLSQNMFNPYL